MADLDAQQLDAFKFAGSVPGVNFIQHWPALVPSDEFLIADTSPIINPVTIAALQQSELVVIPVTPLSLSLEALARTFETVALVRQSHPHLKAMVFFTRVDRKPYTAGIMAATKALSEWPVAQTFIPERLMDFERAVMARRPVVCHAPKSAGAVAYRTLAKEVVEYAKS